MLPILNARNFILGSNRPKEFLKWELSALDILMNTIKSPII